jgi:hypothetical protein
VVEVAVMDIRITGLDQLRRQLDSFSDRRFNAAIATALTRAARDVEKELQREIGEKLDRPTPRSLRSTAVEMANANKLQAVVRLRGDTTQANTPAGWLAPLEFSGNRLMKKFEQALVSRGVMPSGTYAVPGDGAIRDQYGNVSRGQIVAVLNQLGSNFSEGYAKVIGTTAAKRAKAAARSGKRYFAIAEQRGGLPPGIYYRDAKQGLKAVFFFTRNVGYRRQMTLITRGVRVGSQRLNEQVIRAVNEQIAKLAAKGRA